MASIYATAAVRPVLREVGIFNTTALEVAVGLVRLTTLGTVGAAAVEVNEDDPSHTILATVAGTHTGTAPSFTTDAFIRRANLGAAEGSGVIWTFGGNGIIIPNTTGDGVGVICAVGTSQICDVTLTWDE